MQHLRQTLTLRLPFELVDLNLPFERLMAANARHCRPKQPIEWAFAMSRPERRFANGLLSRKRNLWLFRCNQRHFCGDFIVIDMSSHQPDQRSVWAIELKSGHGLKIGGRLGFQMRNAQAAVDQLADDGIIIGGSEFTTVYGDYGATLDWLRDMQCGR